MKTIRFLAFLCLVGVSLGALAQWQWIDNDGRKVFSDRGPSPDIPEKNILQRPVVVRKLPATASASAATTSATKASGTDKSNATAKPAETDDAAARKAEEERIAKIKTENCRIAKQTKAVLDSGARMTRPNAAGEQEVLDDAARAAETKRMQAVIDSDCK